jgi:hypothetical protein
MKCQNRHASAGIQARGQVGWDPAVRPPPNPPPPMPGCARTSNAAHKRSASTPPKYFWEQFIFEVGLSAK